MSTSASPVQESNKSSVSQVVTKEVLNNNIKEEKSLEVNLGPTASEAASCNTPVAYNNYARNLLLVHK